MKMKMLLLNLLSGLCVLLCDLDSAGSSSARPPLTRVRIIEVEDDYDDPLSPLSTRPPRPRPGSSLAPMRPCPYDPCAPQPAPCDPDLSRSGCLCPGLSGPEELPSPPEIRELKPDGSVHWCAPRSVVSFYELTLKDETVKLSFAGGLRSGLIPGLRAGETVCVAARNEAGLSERTCAPFEPAPVDGTALNAGLISGAVGVLLLLLVLAVVLWRRRTCVKSGTGDTEGLPNPSYTSEGAAL